jgi:hypothetical protein
VRWSILAIVLAIVSACSSAGPIPQGPVYPAEKKQGGSVDIQVFRHGTIIRFTNTTARSFPAGRMWLNQWYSREIPPLGVGEKMQLSLREFKDQYGESFRAGGFFATRRPAKLVLAQLDVDDELVGLVVIGED